MNQMTKRSRPELVAEIIENCEDARKLWLTATSPNDLLRAVDLYKQFLDSLATLEKTPKSSAAATTAPKTTGFCGFSGATTTTANADDIDPCFVDEQKMRLLLLLSQIDGKQDEAKAMLKKEGYVATLSQAVLNYAVGGCPVVPMVTQDGETKKASTPAVVVDDVLSRSALVALQSIFTPPNANYWTAHDYCVEPPSPFFSYVMPLDEAASLGPLGALALAVKKTAETNFPSAPKANFAEIWVHNRPHAVGHQLHFDSDDEGRGGIRNPVLGSLFFLSDGVGGPTLVTDQGVTSRKLSDEGFLVHPQRNRLVVFDGRMLHGVIPGKGVAPVNNNNNNNSSNTRDGHVKDDDADEELEKHVNSRRVTLMVALWPEIRIRRENKPGSARPLPTRDLLEKLPWLKVVYAPPSLAAPSDSTSPSASSSSLYGAQITSLPGKVAPVWEKTDGTPWPASAPIPHYDTVFQGF